MQQCKLDINDELNVISYCMLYRPCVLLRLQKYIFIGTLVNGVLGRYIK